MRSAAAVAMACTMLAVLAAPRSGESAYPGRNGKIAFVARGGIHVINSDGTGRRTIVRGVAGHPRVPVATPEWSPDGKRIAFSCRGRICVVSAKGGRPKMLTTRVFCGEAGTGKTVDASPTWSRDGKTLIFDRTCGEAQGQFSTAGLRRPPDSHGRCLVGSACILRMKVDGTGMKRQILWEADAPAWSPSGREIAYTTNTGVWLSRPDGRNKKHILRGYDYVGPLDWSPDGRRIALWDPDTGAMAVVNRDGSGQISFGTGGTMAFSPDGTQIAYGKYASREQRFTGRVFVMSADGQDKRVLVAGADPAWQPLRR